MLGSYYISETANMEDLLDFGCECRHKLVYVCLGANHPVDGKINKILPMDFPDDVIACWALASSMTFSEVLPNSPIASSPVRK